jgi:hypothetical protein
MADIALHLNALPRMFAVKRRFNRQTLEYVPRISRLIRKRSLEAAGSLRRCNTKETISKEEKHED